MSPALLSILLYLNTAAKLNQTGPVFCYWCNNHENFIKYGKYKRFGFHGQELIDIQRYLCRHDQCRRTFSALPHPFLRICRFSYCMLTIILDLLQQKICINEVARRFNSTWPAIRRVADFACRIFSWIDQEIKANPIWSPGPCLNPPRIWSEFIRMFAAKFYPKRYAPI